MKQSRVDIHLVSWYRPEMTKAVIETLTRNTPNSNYRLLVYDNGSPEKQQRMLLDLQERGLIDELFLNDENRGLEMARNMLLQMSHCEYIVCLDNDCLAPPPRNGVDWLQEMFELMRVNPTYAAISMRTQVMIGTGNIFEEADETGEELIEFPHPGGSFRMMKTDVVKEVGGWEGKPGRGAEERYICGKLREAGYNTGFTVQLKCLHLFGVRYNDTDRWGYKKSWTPEETGHSDIWHPALENGDDEIEVLKYAGEKITEEYFNAISDNTKD